MREVFLPHVSPAAHCALLLTQDITFGRWESRESCSKEGIWHTAPKQGPENGAVPGPFDSLAQSPEPPVSGGKRWHSARAHSLRLAPQLQAVLEPVGPRGCVRVGWWLGAMLEEGRSPQGHGPSQANSLCSSRGCLSCRITSTLSTGQERCRLPPTALGMLMLHQGQNGRQWTLCSIPMARCCHCPPWLRGNGSWGWSMPNFTFQMGFLAPGQAAFRVVKYFGKPHLSFSLKRLSLGKRRRAELRAPSQRGGSAALPDTS